MIGWDFVENRTSWVLRRETVNEKGSVSYVKARGCVDFSEETVDELIAAGRGNSSVGTW